MRHAKASLIASIAIGLLAISTAGVSTFAWFQSNASATVTAQSDSTTITVSKPDEYAFYAYRGNKADHTYTGTFATDFETVTASNVETITSLGNLYPTKSATFAVVMTGCTVGSPISLSLTKVTSNSINSQDVDKHRYIRGGTTEINVGWAMDVYTKCVTSPDSNYNDLVNSPESLSAQDKFTCTSSNQSTYLAASSVSSNVITLASPKSFYNANATATTMYLFYTVYFSNDSSTWYKEVDASGNVQREPSTNDTRYFDSDTSNGDSNCYAGLNFALNELSLTF